MSFLGADTPFIVDFLRRHENNPPHYKPLLGGYVPNNGGVPIQQSGVTIATGLDLGQQSTKSLLEMGIPQGIAARLVPYCGLRRYDAMVKLANLPLSISSAEAEAIDTAVIGAYIREVQTRFDRDAGRYVTFPGWRFADRPREVQAVTVSLRYQLGFGGFPKTLGMLIAGNYHGAIAELRDPAKWGGKHTHRRQAEAALLAKAV